MATATTRRMMKRFKPKNEIKWLSIEDRLRHKETIDKLTELALALEAGDELNPTQKAFIEGITQSTAVDTQINAAWNLIDQTEIQYTQRLGEMAPHDLTAYHELMNPGQTPAKHQLMISNELMKVARGEVGTLLLAVPRGCAKTSLASKSFAQWYMGLNPDHRVLGAGHGQKWHDNEISKPNRAAIGSDTYQLAFPDVELSDKEGAADFWRLKDWKGSYTSRGAGAGVLGVRSNLVLADDLFSLPSHAMSQTIREERWNWFAAAVMPTRLPNAPLVMVNCVTGDTPITMADGGWRYIKDVQVGDKILTLGKDNKPSVQVVENWAEQAEDEIIEVHTGHGLVRCNARHPFWTRKCIYKGKWEEEPTWVKAGELNKLDKVMISGKLGVPTEPARLTEDEAWLLGLMYGDGCVSRSYGRYGAEQLYTRVSVSNNKEDHRKVSQVFKQVFDVDLHYKETVHSYGKSARFQTNVLKVGRWLIAHGIAPGVDCHTKRVPEWMFSQPLNVIKAFTDGIVFADGHISKRVVSITLCNKDLVQDVRQLWKILGIKSTSLRKYTQNSTLPGRKEKYSSTRYRTTYTPNVHRTEEPFYWKNVTKIVHTNSKEKVYDIQVSNTHNFLAGGIVVSNTLWHSEDVMSRVIRLARENPETFPQPAVIINIPAQCYDEATDPLGRKLDEWIWPEFYPESHWVGLRNSMPPTLWSSQMQGIPLDQQGEFIAEDDFKRYDQIPINKPDEPIQFTRTVMSIDTPLKSNQRSDYTAICIFRQHVDGTHYLIDAWRGKKKMEEIIRVMRSLISNWNVDYCLIEDSAMGAQILENYGNKMACPIQPMPVSPLATKEFRFDAAAVWITSGKVLFPKQAPWLTDFISELIAFPNGMNDDYVDAFSQYCSQALKKFKGGTRPLKVSLSGGR